MKKLMIAASAALCAAVGFAVESSNVVGYSNNSIEQGKYKMICSQFLTVGKEASAMTVGDLVPGGTWAAGSDYVKVFADNSSVKLQLIYVDEAALVKVKKANPDAIVGWYERGTKTYDTCYNSEPLPLGGTVMAYTSKASSYLTTSGEVVDSETGKITFEIPQGKYLMVGNCTPVALTLVDFVPGGTWAAGSDYIKVFADNSSVALQLIYVDEAALVKVKKANPDAVVGWYERGTKTYDTCYNTRPVAPGEGFMAYTSKAASTIEIPSAL